MDLFLLMVILSPFTALIPGLYGLALICKKKIVIQNNYLNKGVVILFISLMVSSIVNKSLMSIGGSLLILLYFTTAVLSQQYFISEHRIDKMLLSVVYATALTAVLGIGEKITFIFLGNPSHRIFSTYGNPNMTGAWLAAVLLIVLFLKEDKRYKHAKLPINLSLIFIIIALLLTESSGAFIGLIGSVIIYFIVDFKKDKKRILTILLAILILTILFLLMQKKVNSITLFDELKISFSSRYDIWIGSMQMFQLKPLLGWGTLGTMEHGIDFMYRNGNSIHSHNIWLTFLVSGGIIGLIIYLSIKINIIKDIIKLYKCKNRYICLIIAVNTMIIIQGLVDCPLYAPQLGTLFMVMNSLVINFANDMIVSNKKYTKYKLKRYRRDTIAS